MTGEDLSSQDLSLSPEDYSAFVMQIDLLNIWLQEASVINRMGPDTPDQATLRIDETADWEYITDGFRAHHQFKVSVEGSSEIYANINVTFSVDFQSGRPMNDDLFTIFARVNLPINTWPYLREYLASSIGRMNWLTYTLPALKRGPSTSSGE